MDLSPRRRATLAAVCEALIPAVPRSHDPGGYFGHSAAAAGTADAAERLIASIADADDRSRLAALLRVLESPLANLLLSGEFASLDRMTPEARERTLASWAFSGLALRRAGFQALKRLTQVAHYCWPDAAGGHPAWRAVGYPGPLPPPPGPGTSLAVEVVDRETQIACDVVIVGSGAGGGVVAGVLAEAGRSVVVLEKGINPGPADLTQVEGEMLGKLYLDGGLMMTQSGSMPILAGSCVGGGTVVNYTTSFPLPERVRHEWDAISGLRIFSSREFADSLARVSTRLDVGTRYSTPSPRDQVLERGCRTLGWHVEPMPRNVSACPEGLECGYCGYGCRHGAKNSTAKTYLADAVTRGARIVPGCEVERILFEGRRAVGVTAWVRRDTGPPVPLTVRAQRVVVSCGAIHTPALLRRSGVRHPRLGRGLRLHPTTAVAGFFPERIEPWGGAIQARFSDELANQDAGYGAKFETAPIHFALPASGFGWESPQQSKLDIARLGNLSVVGILLRDRDAGRVRVTRDGRPKVHYEPSDYDVRHVRSAIRGAAALLAAAGAEEIVSLQTPPARVVPGRRGWLTRFTAQCDTRGYRRCRMSYITFHQMASAAMGNDPATAVVDETGAVFGHSGLYVADGSNFPTSSGVNPMITIMAVADHVARAIAGQW